MKKSIFTILPMALLASCSSELMETTDNNINSGDVEKISIVSHPFVFDDDTRTSLTATEKSIIFAWADYDAMGVFPVAPYTNSQMKRELSVPAGTDAHYATFDGAGWELKSGNTYAAYVPYNGNLTSSTPYSAIPIDMTHQNGTLYTIGLACDYMYALSSYKNHSNNSSVSDIVFDFKHAVSLLQLKITVPVSANWTNVTLTNDAGDKVWVMSATMNAATGEVTPKNVASRISIPLYNVSTTDKNKTITLYWAVLPTTTGKLKISALTSDYKRYTSTVDSRTFVAGKAYRYETTLSEAPASGVKNDYEWVDLGLSVMWASRNVGSADVTDFGKYYAWGETKAYGEEDLSNNTNYQYNSQSSYVKKYYDWRTYKWCNGSYSKITKYYRTSDYNNDEIINIEAEDDAATQNWGMLWRMPTKKEIEELLHICKWKWINSYNNVNVNGFIVTGPNENSIFLPAAGYCKEFQVERTLLEGLYWSSSVEAYWGSTEAFLIETNSMSLGCGSIERYIGLPVRAVCE